MNVKDKLQKYTVLKENTLINFGTNEISSQILQMYVKGLYHFYEMIPTDYKDKDKMLYLCFDIRDRLIRSAPEIISGRFLENILRLIPYMPKDDTYWNQEAWDHLLNSAKEVNKILDDNDI